MKIGVPRERKTLERRVGLTPDGAAELTKAGHQVFVEVGAGLGAHLEDNDYIQAGCQMVPTLKDVWTKSDLIVKVKEPHESEYEFMRPGLMIFDYLHLASMPELAQQMTKSQMTGIAFELVQDAHGRHPLLDPMSEVAGKLSVQSGAYYLLSQHGGRGMLLGGTTGISPCRVVIIGAGVAGTAACDVALGMGGRVTIMDKSVQALERIKVRFGNAPRTILSTRASIERECLEADLLIGAVLVPGAAAPKVVTREIIKKMKKGAVFIDISIDQGGCSETIRPTSLDNPVYEVDGVIHYGVCNMPAQTARTSTFALAAATLPYVLRLAKDGIHALKHTDLRVALNTHQGLLTNQAVSEAVNIPYTPIEKALGF
jgi:alanine dehydrogenase